MIHAVGVTEQTYDVIMNRESRSLKAYRLKKSKNVIILNGILRFMLQ